MSTTTPLAQRRWLQRIHPGHTTVRFLLLPNPANDADGSNQAGIQDAYSLEGLLSRTGLLSRRARDDKDWVSELDAYDVIFLEIGDDADVALCHELRRLSLKPLFLYGANVPATTWILGLQSGADAYLSLPTNEDVLNARLQAVLRRS